MRIQQLIGPLTPGVRAIIIACAACFVLQILPGTGPLMGNLVLVPRMVVQQGAIWQLVTYLFLHGTPTHLVLNMLSLWMIGGPVESSWGTRRFVGFYLGTGAFAGLCTLAQSSPTMGASGALIAVLVAFAMLYPEATVLFFGIFPLKAPAMAGLLVAMDFLSSVANPNGAIAYICHLGGAVAGYAYIKHSWRIQAWLNRPRATGNKVVAFRAPQSSDAVVRDFRARSTGGGAISAASPRSASPLQGATAMRASASAEDLAIQQRADAILDKISREGMGSVTREEREILQRHSQLLKAREDHR